MENAVKYKGLVATLTREILGGKFVPLGTFPSERALAQRFGVARQTVRNAMRELIRRGLVYSRQGQGTFLTRGGANLCGGVGLILTGDRRSEIGRAIRSELERLAGHRGLTLAFGDASSLDARIGARSAVRLAERIAAAKVSGVILQPVEFVPDAEKINARIVNIFSAAKIPVVLIDCDIVGEPLRSAYDVVGIDNFQAGRRLALHLKEAGVETATFLTQTNYPTTVAERLRGVRSVLPPSAEGDVILTSLTPDSVARAFRRRSCPSALVCQNDIAAVNALAALRQRRWRCPDDVLVAGFDDVSYASLVRPALTTVRQPCRCLAARAFDRLLARIASPELPVSSERLSADLVVRASTQLQKVV